MHPSTIPDVGARDLLAVVTIARQGSFIAAALTLHVSQAALTRTVQRMEQALGVALFVRSTRRVELTPAGREFAGVAQRMLNDLRISVRGMQEISGEQRGQVIVACIISVALTTLPDIVAGYRRDRPKVEIHIREGVHGSVLEDVRSGVADLGITYLGNLPEGIASHTLGREGFYIVLPAGHKFDRKRGMKLEELQGVPLISLPAEAHTRRFIDTASATVGVILDHSITCTQVGTIINFVRAGVGAALVPYGAVPAARDAGLEIRPLVSPKMSNELGMVWLRERATSPVATGFMAEVRKHLGKGKPRK